MYGKPIVTQQGTNQETESIGICTNNPTCDNNLYQYSFQGRGQGQFALYLRLPMG